MRLRKKPEKSYYVDQDTTDDFLDAPDIVYTDGTTLSEHATWAATPGNVKNPMPLPPLTEH